MANSATEDVAFFLPNICFISIFGVWYLCIIAAGGSKEMKVFLGVSIFVGINYFFFLCFACISPDGTKEQRLTTTKICIFGVAYLCIIAAGTSMHAFAAGISIICFFGVAYLCIIAAFLAPVRSVAETPSVGVKVMAPWTNGKLYPGKVSRVTGAGVVTILFDDGDTRAGVAWTACKARATGTVSIWWQENPSRPRFAASAVTFLFALVGFLLVFFAACGQPHIVVGGWDSGAAAAASDALPAHMRAPVHRSMGYPDSEIWIGPTIVSCWGENKRACAKNHIFSPVAPPEPPALWTNGVTKLAKKTRFEISNDICGQMKGKDKNDRSSYNDTHAPPNRAFWSGASHAQARVLDALCGGRFRAPRDNLSAAGYASLLWLGITAVALIFGSEGHDGWYLLPVVLCSIFGALALAAHDHWAGFVDVVKPAYPHRSVELGGWPQEFTLIGGIMLLCAAFSSLVAAFLGSRADWKFSKTTPEVSEPVAVASGGAGREPVAGVVVESWVVEERPFG